MLQGNPFETRLVVDERTKMVQDGVKEQRQPYTPSNQGNLLREWQEVLSSLDFVSLGTRSLQVAEDAWWLPAGIAIGILLNSLLGG